MQKNDKKVIFLLRWIDQKLLNLKNNFKNFVFLFKKPNLPLSPIAVVHDSAEFERALNC